MPELFWARWNAMPSPLSVTVRLMRLRRRWFLIAKNIEKRGALEIARQLLQRLNAVFRYAVQTGRATYNPAADMQGVLKSRKVVHRAALSGDELPEFMQALMRADIDTATKLALQFTILTAARSGETRGATWAEISLDAALWRGMANG